MEEWALTAPKSLIPGAGEGNGEPENQESGAALAEQRVLRPMPLSGFDPSHNSVFFPNISHKSFRRRGPKVEIEGYTVQCILCFSWRKVPSRELYESIRQRMSERPWCCGDAAAWNPNASCAQPSELQMQASSQEMIWCIDKPDLPKTPTGWKRDVVIRSEGCVKFADVYYNSPCGKRLRSMVEIRKFLEEHPRYYKCSESDFSFTTPQPVDKGYVRKRAKTDNGVPRLSLKSALRNDSSESSFPPVPPGWVREIVVRSVKSSKLCDVYYISPCMKKIRSMVEMNEFLHENPSYVFEGVSLDQFSFNTPLSERDLRKAASEAGVTVRAIMRGSNVPGPPLLITMASDENEIRSLSIDES